MTSGKPQQQDEEQQYLQSYPSGTPGYYGTFQGNPGFPQPVHPSQAGQFEGYGRIEQGIPVDPHHYHQQHNEEHLHYRRRRLPCCGLGMGWLLFIMGFFTLSLPWFVGAIVFFCFEHDPREHVGLGACAIAALIAFLVGGGTGLHSL